MIQYGEDKYKGELISLWKLCFPEDSDAFIQFYFDKVYENENTLIYIEDDKVVSSLQIIPYPVKIGNVIFPAGYISGAMTHPGFQKKGHMASLLNASFDEMKQKKYNYTFLIPQEEWLFDFYEKWGYERAFPIHKESIIETPGEVVGSNILRDKSVKICRAIEETDMDDFYIIYSRFLMEKHNVVLKTKQHFVNILWDLFEDGGIALYNDWGIAFLYPQKEIITIREFFYFDEEIKREFLNTININYAGKEIIIHNNPNAPFLKYGGMIKSLDESIDPVCDIYMSMMLD